MQLSFSDDELNSHRALADSLMEQVSRFTEEHCEAEILEETREIR